MAKLSINSAWEEAAGFVRREGRLLFPISFMLIALPGALGEALAPAPGTGGEAGVGGLWLLLFLLALLPTAIGNVAITFLAIRPGTSVAEALRRGAARLLPLLAAAAILIVALLLLFMIFVVATAGLVPGAIEAAKAGAPTPAFSRAMLLAVLILLPIALFFSARLMLVTPLAANEEGGPLRLIARSWQLTAGHGWVLVATLLLVTIVYAVAWIAVQAVAGLVVVALFGQPAPGSLAAFLITLVAAGVTTLAAPYLASFFARIYAQLAA